MRFLYEKFYIAKPDIVFKRFNNFLLLVKSVDAQTTMCTFLTGRGLSFW